VGVNERIKNGWKKEQLCCFDVSGDSMEPTLYHGSRVLIDMSQHEIIDNKIYALRNGSQVFIKRLYKVFNQPKVVAKSDNPLYPELQIDLSSENADLKIVGMAVLRLEEPL
jgi:phage repressor protein C with HTH and peptisase S24 domain